MHAALRIASHRPKFIDFHGLVSFGSLKGIAFCRVLHRRWIYFSSFAVWIAVFYTLQALSFVSGCHLIFQRATFGHRLNVVSMCNFGMSLLGTMHILLLLLLLLLSGPIRYIYRDQLQNWTRKSAFFRGFSVNYVLLTLLLVLFAHQNNRRFNLINSKC